MTFALIDPTTSVQHVVSWVEDRNKVFQPVLEVYPNSARVAEVLATTFEIALPLFWTTCADNVVADAWYYDKSNSTINLIVNEPMPEPVQPTVTGAQTL